MRGRVRVLRGMAVRRRVAAQCSAAGLADPQMNPVSADLHALVALRDIRLPGVGYCPYMGAAFFGGHGDLLIPGVLGARKRSLSILLRLPTRRA